MATNFKKEMAKQQQRPSKKVHPTEEALGLVFRDSEKKSCLIQISALSPNPHQPRTVMGGEELDELAHSIKQSGLLQPIIITPIDGSPQKFYIVAGHRRYEAHKILERTEVEAIVVNIDEEELKVYSIIENLQREDLSTYEEALAILKLKDSGFQGVEVAHKLGKTKSYVSQMLKIATLDQSLIDFINGKNMKIGPSHLYEYTRIPAEEQLKTIKYVFENSIDREGLRDLIDNMGKTKDKKVSPAKLSPSGFVFKATKKKVSFKVDLENMKSEEKEEAIERLEDLLTQLKEINV